MRSASVSDQIFVARKPQLALFQEYTERWLLSLSRSDEGGAVSPALFKGLFVSVHGHSGFGKSVLLKRFHSLALETSNQLHVSSIINWHTFFEHGGRDHLSVVQAYFDALQQHLSTSLEPKPAFGFTHYAHALQSLKQFKHESKKMATQKRQRDHLSTISQELRYARDLLSTDVSMPASDVNLSQRVRVLQEYISISASSFIDDFYLDLRDSCGADLDEYLQPARFLGRALGTDLYKLAEDRPCIIFFDSYENIDEGDNYLCEVMLAAGNRVGWVMAGHKNIWSPRSVLLQYNQQVFPAYEDFVQPELALSISLTMTDGGVLTSDDIIAYFDVLHQQQPSLPMISPEVASYIQQVTQGIPLAVSIVANFYARKKDLQALLSSMDTMAEIIEKLVSYYLSHAPLQSEDRKKLCALALVRRADDSMMSMTALGFMPGQEDAYEEDLVRLHRLYGFVLTDQGFPTLHQEVRYWLRLWLLRPQQVLLLRPIVQYLKDEYQARFLSLEQLPRFRDLRSRFEDDQWIEAYLDVTEICFWSEPTEGTLYALLFAIAAAVYRPSAFSILEDIVHPFIQNIPHPYVKWWESAQACLLLTAQEARNSWSRTQMLNQLGTLIAGSRLSCSSVLASYLMEMEALIWWSIGDCYRDEEPKTASSWYRKAWEHLYDDQKLQELLLDFYMQFAYQCQCEGRYDESIEYLQYALSVNAQSADVYYSLGNAFYAQQNYTQAILEYHRTIYYDADHLYAFINLGNTQGLLKNYTRAIAEYSEALKLSPHESVVYYNRANAYAELRDYARALQDYEQALTLYPRFAQAYGNRGNVYALLGEFAKALADYNKTSELLPDDINATWMAVWANLGQDGIDMQEAAQLLRVAELHTEHYLAHVCRGVVFGFRDGDLARALTEIRQALLQGGEGWDSYFWQGLLYAYQGDYPGAQAAITKALDLGLPPLLLKPLYWLEDACFEFFSSYAHPLLNEWKL